MTSINSYYGTDSTDRSERVRSLFDRIASRYDLVNDLQSFGLHRFWKHRLIQLARLQPDAQALDVCCGTGDVALALAEEAASVHGVDFSAPMLDVARQRARTQPKVAFLESDALQLPFEANRFDVVTIAYGLRNITAFDAAITELIRVLRPGGRLLILDFGKPQWAVWRSCYFAYLRWVVPVFGKLFCNDPAAYSYILESLRHYPAQEGVDQALRTQGLTETRVHNFLGGVMSINEGVKPKG